MYQELLNEISNLQGFKDDIFIPKVNHHSFYYVKYPSFLFL